MLITAVNTAALFVLSYECFRRLQGANYRPQRGYFRLLLSPYFAVLLVVQAGVLAVRYCNLPEWISCVSYAVPAVIFAVIPRKSPLKFTKRVLRFAAVQLILCFVLCFFKAEIFCIAALPVIALLSYSVCLPVDILIARHYLKKAVKKLEQSNVTVVAVTGSYGKTTVKDMLAAILDDSVSPNGSCNTPLGIASFINKTDLYYVKYLVLEFGARKKGDIAELCRLFKPKYGIITGVCPQHLSTFKTWDNVVNTKRELVESLPANGSCVLNVKDETAVSYINAGACKNVLSDELAEIKLENITADGALIKVKCGKTEKQVKLPQITAHVADTFAMCLTMCLTLKQSFTKTLSMTVNVKQTPHRMEISKAANCYIIDDGYNGSLAGVASAAETLAHFTQFKTVVTQGLVECGNKRKEYNVKCGRILGNACNVAIVLGSNKKYLAEGLSETDCKVIFAKNLKQAVALAQPYLNGENSILLFQNDLPDF